MSSSSNCSLSQGSLLLTALPISISVHSHLCYITCNSTTWPGYLNYVLLFPLLLFLLPFFFFPVLMVVSIDRCTSFAIYFTVINASMRTCHSGTWVNTDLHALNSNFMLLVVGLVGYLLCQSTIVGYIPYA